MPNNDSVPVMLSHGEYRVPADVLEKYGDELLSILNGSNVMPLERKYEHDRYGHLLSERDEVVVRQRKLSPKFPDVATVLLRRQKRREELTARILLFGMAASIIWSILGADWAAGAVSFVFCSVGFGVTCIVAGNRAHKRAGASGNPF